MSKYDLNLDKESLPTFCERISEYWSTKRWVPVHASGQAAAKRYKSVKAFREGLRKAGLSEEIISKAYTDTL